MVWLVASVLAMAILTAFVFIGTWRRRLAGESFGYVTFEPTGRVIDLTARAGPGHPDDGHDREHPDAPQAGTVPTEDEGPDRPLRRPAPVSGRSDAVDRLLAGVSLPCGLQELPDDGHDGRRRVAFHTTGHPPREVAIGVVDELERLGVHLEPLSYSEARAFRDGFEVAVTMFVEPGRVVRDRRLAFPGVDPKAIVIEFSAV